MYAALMIFNIRLFSFYRKKRSYEMLNLPYEDKLKIDLDKEVIARSHTENLK